MRPELLILGGTTEGRELAEAVAARFGDRVGVVTSLAGATAGATVPPGRVRLGGFGGLNGLLAFLEEARIDLVVDATHPFAARISHTLRLACERAGIPRLTIVRPPWQAVDGDLWITVPDNESAACRLVELGAKRPFLTLGSRDLAAYAAVPGARFLVRRIADDGAPPPLLEATLTPGRGPFAVDDEIALMRREGVDVLVTKASGGAATYAKIEAARRLGLPVVMINRPPPEAGESVATAAAALAWIAART